MAQRTSTRPSARRRSTTQRGSKAAKRTASEASGQAQRVASNAADKGQEVADVASRQANEVVSTAKDQASRVTDEVSAQAQRMFEETRTRVQSEAETQTQQLASKLRDIGREAKALADGRSTQGDTVKGYLRQAGTKLTELADDVDSRGVEGLISDAQDFARRRPAAFLLGAGAAGFLASRFVRGASAGSSQGNTSKSGNGRKTVTRTRSYGALPPSAESRSHSRSR